MNPLPTVKHIVAVASGKGGVGKSTVAVNLALALSKQGLRVGLLDADIYGPSQSMMLGAEINGSLEVVDELLLPVKLHGIETMSISFVSSDRTPAIWRGPMASGAMEQLLTKTKWGQLDVLLVDMPPGTGDIQLTLAQKVRVSGAIIVTTPQNVALLDARKGIEMFRRVSIPVIGIVENMSIYVCPECGHEDRVYGKGGGNSASKEYDTLLLGEIPLNSKIRECSDEGQPIFSEGSEKPLNEIFIKIADTVQKFLDSSSVSIPTLQISDD